MFVLVGKFLNLENVKIFGVLNSKKKIKRQDQKTKHTKIENFKNYKKNELLFLKFKIKNHKKYCLGKENEKSERNILKVRNIKKFLNFKF